MLNYSCSVKLFFTIVFIIYSQYLFAQGKIVKGYYINIAGDTVQGQFIDFKQWNKNPSAVDFLPEGSANKLLLTPSVSRGFNINENESYIAYQGTRLQNPVTYNTATAAEADEYQTVSAFLRQI